MVKKTVNWLMEVVVELIYALFIGFRVALAGKDTPAHDQLPERFPDGSVVRQGLGDDVVDSLESVLDGRDTLLLVQIVFRKCCRVTAVLGKDRLGQGLQALFPGDGTAGPPLLLVGAVQVLNLRQSGGGVNGVCQVFREFSLVFDGLLYLIPAFMEIPEVAQPGFQGPEGGVVHGAVHFFAVPGDKGNGVALVHEVHHILNIFLLLAQFLGQDFYNRLHKISSLHWIPDNGNTIWGKMQVVLDIQLPRMYNI